jgi:putative transposase
LVHLRFPSKHRKRIRLSLVWTVLDRASRGWRGLTITPKALRRLQDLRRELLHQRSDHNQQEVAAETATTAA